MQSHNGTGAGRMLAAARIRAEMASCPDLGNRDSHYAERYERMARSTDLPAERFQPGAGGEIIDQEAEPVGTGHGRWMTNTLQSPDYVAAGASRDRCELAERAGTLGLALDTADTINARDSLERMLAHQLATIHHAVMRTAERLSEEIEWSTGVLDVAKREAHSVRASRYAGAMARLAVTFQQGVMVLERKRSGGVQRVQVQYTDQRVNVAEGGQAVIAGSNVDARPDGGGRGAKHRGNVHKNGQ